MQPGPRNLSTRYIALIYLGWWIVWMVLQTLVLTNAGLLSLELAIKDSAITSVILALGGYIMITSMRYYHPREILQLTWSIGLAVGCVLVIRGTASIILGGETGYSQFL